MKRYNVKPFMNKAIVCLLASVALGTVVGCQSQNTTSTKKTGSYTAARRNAIGSHIPQPYSADSVDSTVDQDAYLRDQQRLSNSSGSMGRGALGGGGAGGR